MAYLEWEWYMYWRKGVGWLQSIVYWAVESQNSYGAGYVVLSAIGNLQLPFLAMIVLYWSTDWFCLAARTVYTTMVLCRLPNLLKQGNRLMPYCGIATPRIPTMLRINWRAFPERCWYIQRQQLQWGHLGSLYLLHIEHALVVPSRQISPQNDPLPVALPRIHNI